MLKKLQEWIEKRKQIKKRQRWVDGFDYAAGALLRGEESPESLRAYFFYAPWDDFDRGCEEAIHRLVTLSVIEDDRL